MATMDCATGTRETMKNVTDSMLNWPASPIPQYRLDLAIADCRTGTWKSLENVRVQAQTNCLQHYTATTTTTTHSPNKGKQGVYTRPVTFSSYIVNHITLGWPQLVSGPGEFFFIVPPVITSSTFHFRYIAHLAMISLIYNLLWLNCQVRSVVLYLFILSLSVTLYIHALLCTSICLSVCFKVGDAGGCQRATTTTGECKVRLRPPETLLKLRISEPRH